MGEGLAPPCPPVSTAQYAQLFCIIRQAFVCLAYANDNCTVTIENIRNMHVVSTNRIANILHFSNRDITLLHCLPFGEVKKLF